MLRKISRSFQKDQNMGHPTVSDNGCESYSQSDLMGQKQKTNSFFSVPGLLVGLNPKGLLDCDSVRSPTSPLDFRVFSNLGNSFRSPRSHHDGHYQSWDCSKVGLSIIESLDDDTKLSGRVSRSSDCKNIIIGPQMRIKSSHFRNDIDVLEKPKSLPKNYAICTHPQIKSSNLQNENSDSLFEIGEGPLETEPIEKIRSCSLDSSRCFNSFANGKPNSSSETRTNLVNSPPQFIGRSPNFDNSFPTNLSSIPISMGSGHGFIGSPTANETYLSEDHTFSHGPYSKTIHNGAVECFEISVPFQRFISAIELDHSENHGLYPKTIHNHAVECFEISVPFQRFISAIELDHSENHGLYPKTIHNHAVECSEISVSFPLNNFLSFCYSCKKKLDGEDIYMYRGEKAFCSLICREQEILIDGGLEETIDDLPENFPEDDGDNTPQQGMFITT